MQTISKRQFARNLGDHLFSTTYASRTGYYVDKIVENIPDTLDRRILDGNSVSRRRFAEIVARAGIAAGVAYAGSRFGIGDVRGHREPISPKDSTVYMMNTVFSEKTLATIDGKYDTTILDVAKDDNGNDLPLNEWNEIPNLEKINTQWLGQPDYITQYGIFGLKETDTTIQGFIDLVYLPGQEMSGVAVAIDALHNAGVAPQPDDYEFAVVKVPTGYDIRFFQGTGSTDMKWKLIEQPSFIKVGYSYTGTPNQEQPHYFEEFELNKKELGTGQDKFGLAIRATVASGMPTRVSWPVAIGDLDNPSIYGDVISAQKPTRIPEFSYLKGFTLGLSLAIPLIGIERIRRRKNELRI